MICSQCLKYFESITRNGIDLTCSEKCKMSRRKRIRTEEDRRISFFVISIIEKGYEKVLNEMGVRR